MFGIANLLRKRVKGEVTQMLPECSVAIGQDTLRIAKCGPGLFRLRGTAHASLGTGFGEHSLSFPESLPLPIRTGARDHLYFCKLPDAYSEHVVHREGLRGSLFQVSMLVTEGKTEREIEIDRKAYDHEYLGDVTGTGGAVFENLTLRTIT
ncbi:MAG: hypothetical protein ACO22W_12655, partial [Steroidobacteraceae bacterium]